MLLRLVKVYVNDCILFCPIHLDYTRSLKDTFLYVLARVYRKLFEIYICT